WYRVDGKPFVDTVDGLTNGNFYYPLRIDEHGLDIAPADDNLVGTGTMAYGDGGFLYMDCTGFTSDVSVMIAGYLDGGASAWTDAEFMAPCTSEIHVYCFGVSKNVILVPPEPPPDSKLAFITTVTFGGGAAALDATCQNAAQTAGY